MTPSPHPLDASRELLTDLLDLGRCRPEGDPCWAHPGLSAARDAGYIVFERLADGGESQVWLGCDEQKNEMVAIKVAASAYDPADAAGVDDDAGLIHEAQLLEGIRHEHVVRARAYGNTPGRGFLVLDFIEGDRLDEIVSVDLEPPIERIVRTLVGTVADLHRDGIVHGDLKPTNVLVDPVGRPTLIDFGLARAAAEDQGILPRLAAKLRAGGTYGYLAPELRTDSVRRPPTKRSDVFSLATILAELIDTYPTLSRWRKTIQRGLAADPDARFPDAGALLRALDQTDARRRIWRLRVAAGVALTAMVASVLAGRHLADRSGEPAALAPDLGTLYRDVVAGLPDEDPARLRERLERIPEPQQGWFWRFMRARIDGRGVTHPYPNLAKPHAATSLTATPDAGVVAWCAMIDGDYVVQHQSLGGTPRPLLRVPQRPRGLTLSPEGHWLALRSADRSITLVNLDEPTWRVATPPGINARGVGFDPLGDYRFRDAATGRLHRLSVLDGDTSAVSDQTVLEALPLTAGTKQAAGFLSIRQNERGQRYGVWETGSDRRPLLDHRLQDRIVTAACGGPTADTLCLATSLGEVFVFDPRASTSLEPLWRDPGGYSVTALAYAPSQGLLFVASNSVRVISTVSGQELAELPLPGVRDVVDWLHWNEADGSLTLVGRQGVQVWTAP